MSSLNLRVIARALGGEISGRQVLAPGPGHSRRDRSLSVRLSPQSLTGYIVHSHAGDNFALCKDHVRNKLGLDPNGWKRQKQVDNYQVAAARPATDEADRRKRIVRAVELWSEAKPPSGTLVETYLRSRGLTVPDTDALRFHPRCPWRDEAANRTIFVPCMIAAMRTIDGDEIHAVHRTRLNLEGQKVDRRMLGVAAGTAVKLDGDDAVTHGLAIGEGVESCIAARQMGFRPVWALASASGIASFPVLGGVEALTLLGENDPTSDRAITQCAERWHAAKREITIATPNHGSDMNDVLRGAA